MITRKTASRSWSPLLVGVLLASALLVAACEMDPPEPVVSPEADAETAPTPELAPVAQVPTFTPYTQKPELLSRGEIGRLLEAAYPPVLRAAGVGGTAVLWVFIDEEGVVRNTRVAESSGEAALDEAAERVMRQMRFRPARNHGVAAPVWIQLPVSFRPQAEADAPEAEARSEAPARRADVPARSEAAAGAPAFTSFDTKPALQNRADFARALKEAYPAVLKEAGVGGTAVLWVHIDPEGQVTRTRISRSSGVPALDQAAQEAMQRARFSPALNDENATAVWIQLPIVFRAPA